MSLAASTKQWTVQKLTKSVSTQGPSALFRDREQGRNFAFGHRHLARILVCVLEQTVRSH